MAVTRQHGKNIEDDRLLANARLTEFQPWKGWDEIVRIIRINLRRLGKDKIA